MLVRQTDGTQAQTDGTQAQTDVRFYSTGDYSTTGPVRFSGQDDTLRVLGTVDQDAGRASGDVSLSELARTFSAAACVALPVITEAREACAPMPYWMRSVCPATTRTCR